VSVTPLEASQGLEELSVRVCLVFHLSLFSSPGTVSACSFYSLKEVQSYKILVRGVILVGVEARRPWEGLIRWRHGLYC
jgi:hypothetical protein